jgi:tetratricopeptide (TPR) repeat protein
VVVSYFSDTWQAARIDVRLKAALPADALRDQFGTRVVTRKLPDGAVEELFYPRLQALAIDGASATAIGYLSRRWVADYYAEQFNERYGAGNVDEARFAADKAVIVAPDYARGYVAQGIVLHGQGKLAEAKARFTSGANAPASPFARGRAYMWLARCHDGAQEAEAAFRKAIENAPTLVEAHVSYGRFLVSHNRHADAIAAFRKAVELDAKNMDARGRLADALRHERRHAEEFAQLEALYKWAEDGGTNDLRMHTNILLRYAGGLRSQPQRALPVYEKAAQLNAQDARALLASGDLLRETGDPTQAADRYRSGLQRDPKSFELQRGLGRALLEAGRYAEAQRAAEGALTLSAKPSAAQMVEVARTWSALREKKQALAWLEKAVAAGYADRQYLNSDRYLAPLRDRGDFKKILERMP